MKNIKRIVILLIIIIMLVSLSGCIPNESEVTNTAGFFSGVWHGWIAPVSLFLKIFNSDYSIYNQNNTGFWYEFGFYMAIISGFGSLSLFRNKKKDKNDS